MPGFYEPADIEVPTLVLIAESTIELLGLLSPLNDSWRKTPLDFIDTVNSRSFISEIILKAPHWPNRNSFVGP